MGKKKSGFLKEFKEFAIKGNILYLASYVVKQSSAVHSRRSSMP